MSRIGRYIFRQAFVAFAASLLTLTGIVWLTQILREIDVITIQGQTLWTFLIITVLSLPAFASVIAPVALFIAVLHTLNRLNADSELVVMNAAGIPRRRIFAPFLVLAALVAVMVGLINIYLMPQSLSTLRVLVTEARANLISQVIQPGRFSTLESRLTFHISDRTPRGDLIGLLVDDARDKTQRLTYIADRGRIAETPEGTFLVMENGNVQRQLPEKPGQVQIVRFDRYLIDVEKLSQTSREVTTFKPRERSLAFLLSPDPDDPYYKDSPGRFRAELHQRLSSPLLPFALTFIGLAFAGIARSTREGGAVAVGAAIVAATFTEIFLFGAINLTRSFGWASLLVYLVPLIALGGAAAVAFGLIQMRLVWVRGLYAAVSEWVRRRLPPAWQPEGRQ